jgi:uncharacterized coiled-coil protein SlyX
MNNNDEYMESLEKKIASLEKRLEAQEQEFFTLLDVIKDIRMMNSFGKTKDIADEIDLLIKKYTE